MANLVFFHAHPDDEAISTGGTMALMADAGHRQHAIVRWLGDQAGNLGGADIQRRDRAMVIGMCSVTHEPLCIACVR